MQLRDSYDRQYQDVKIKGQIHRRLGDREMAGRLLQSSVRVRKPRFPFSRRCINECTHDHSNIEERGKYGPEVGADPHPTHRAKNVTVYDEKGEFEE